MPQVLFVCMGNICRSPTAHAVFRAASQLEIAQPALEPREAEGEEGDETEGGGADAVSGAAGGTMASGNRSRRNMYIQSSSNPSSSTSGHSTSIATYTNSYVKIDSEL